MNSLEHLEDQACKDGIRIVNHSFNSDRIKGLYCDGTIALNDNIKTSSEKACVLAEELGHHYTSVGNILDLTVTENRKQERQARIWAYNKQIGLNGLIRAYENGCKNRYEIAEFLEVTEQFLEEAILEYREIYGICTSHNNYIVYFIPQLIICKRI